MKTSFNKTIAIEEFLGHKMLPQDAVLFQAKLLVDSELKRDTLIQRMVYRLTRLYGRKKAKAAIELMHKRLFNDPLKASFREGILKNFNV